MSRRCDSACGNVTLHRVWLVPVANLATSRFRPGSHTLFTRATAELVSILSFVVNRGECVHGILLGRGRRESLLQQFLLPCLHSDQGSARRQGCSQVPPHGGACGKLDAGVQAGSHPALRGDALRVTVLLHYTYRDWQSDSRPFRTQLI